MPRYKYDSAHEWLSQHIQRLDSAALVSIINDLASKCDGDTIQDLFQDDMEKDEYFKDLDREVPVLFEMDSTEPHAEAIGSHPFCSEECRSNFHSDFPSKPGIDKAINFPDGIVCTECGSEL